MSEEPKVKGAAVREFLEWFSRTYGAEKLARVVHALPADVQPVFNLDDAHLGLLASAWYPAPAIHAMLDAVTADMSPAQRERFVREGAQALIKGTLRGVYRLLFAAMMTPEKYARDAQKLFSRYFNTGVMTKIVTPTGHMSLIRDWTSHHPIFCDFLIYTGEVVYAALGCKDVHMHKTACVAAGAPECSFEVTWSGP